MVISRLHLNAADADTMLALARQVWPQECCGLLVGRQTGETLRVELCVPAKNVAKSPERGFEVDTPTLIAAHKTARARGLALLGSFHSHPHGDPVPSSLDWQRRVETMPLWLIVAASAGRAGPLRAYRAANDGFEPLMVDLVAAPTATHDDGCEISDFGKG